MMAHEKTVVRVYTYEEDGELKIGLMKMTEGLSPTMLFATMGAMQQAIIDMSGSFAVEEMTDNDVGGVRKLLDGC